MRILMSSWQIDGRGGGELFSDWLMSYHVKTTLCHDIMTYRNSLYFRCKNIFVHRKRTKIFCANNFYNKNFSNVGSIQRTHQYFSNCCCPYILVYVASNTTSNLLFTAISSARGAISSINAHHRRLVKLFSFNLVCPKIILHE